MPSAMGPSDRGPRHPANFAGARRTTSIQSIPIGPVTTTAGTPISGMTIYLHDVATGARVQTGTTDATGMCVFYCNNSGLYFALGFKAGSPNVVFCSDFNLAAA